MFRLIGVIVVFYFVYKVGVKMGVIKEHHEEKPPKKIKEKNAKRSDAVTNYYYEVITDENGNEKRIIRAVEQLNRDTYQYEKDGVSE